MPNLITRRVLQPIRHLAATLFKEHLDPRHAAAAVFLGIFIGVVPIYGFQSLTVLGLAALLRLNKPIAFAATWINNPFLQPFLIVGGLEVGHFLLTGKLLHLSMAHSMVDLKSQLAAWVIGSVVLGLLLGAAAAAIVFLILRWRRGAHSPRRERSRFVNTLFASCSNFDRGFVRWKMRLDRVFDILSSEDLGSGLVVDLGCGYGIALGFAAFCDPQRRILGCDLDSRRIAAARQAFTAMNAEFSLGDVRTFEFSQASLIFIFDVLQYLTPTEQLALLERCTSALAPGGKLIFRIPDRGSKMTSRLSMAFDRLIFFFGKNRLGPVVLPAADYQRVFDGARLLVRQTRMRNRLPIAHRLFVVTRPAAAEVEVA